MAATDVLSNTRRLRRKPCAVVVQENPITTMVLHEKHPRTNGAMLEKDVVPANVEKTVIDRGILVFNRVKRLERSLRSPPSAPGDNYGYVVEQCTCVGVLSTWSQCMRVR